MYFLFCVVSSQYSIQMTKVTYSQKVVLQEKKKQMENLWSSELWEIFELW